MHSKNYKVVISKPVDEVFEFTLNPKNTPLWIDDMEEEQASEKPAKLGTLYRNRGKTGGWSEYEITAFEEGRTFTLSKKDGSYHVTYDFAALADNKTEFQYSEWEDSGTLENPLPEKAIQKLKDLIEAKDA